MRSAFIILLMQVLWLADRRKLQVAQTAILAFIAEIGPEFSTGELLSASWAVKKTPPHAKGNCGQKQRRLQVFKIVVAKPKYPNRKQHHKRTLVGTF
jgi:hypothetical protein